MSFLISFQPQMGFFHSQLITMEDIGTRSPGVPFVKQILIPELKCPIRRSYSSILLNYTDASFNGTSSNDSDDKLKHSSTQTSRTTLTKNGCCLKREQQCIKLTVTPSSQMSPDSLCSPTSTNYRIESCPNVVRRRNIIRYVRYGSQHEGDKLNFRSGSSLTSTFLEKMRLKQLTVETNSNKQLLTKIHQQQEQPLSPVHFALRFPHYHRSSSLKSQSCIEHTSRKLGFDKKAVKLNITNLEKDKSVASSYMSPTFSSKQKNRIQEMEDVTKLMKSSRRTCTARLLVSERNRHITLSTYNHQLNKWNCGKQQQRRSNKVANWDFIYPNKHCTKANDNNGCSVVHSREQHLMHSITKLKDNDWNVALEGLTDIVELCRSKQNETTTIDLDFIHPHVTIIYQKIIELLRSPRSHLSRTACQIVGHLFELIKDSRRPEFDEIVNILMCRTADSNKFLRHDANLALDSMVTHIPILHSIRAICAKGPTHKNALVRIAAARLLVCIVILAGAQHVLSPRSSDFNKKRIIQHMIAFMDDKVLDIRKYGERLFKLLAPDKMFEMYLKRYVERESVEKVEHYLMKKESCEKIRHTTRKPNV